MALTQEDKHYIHRTVSEVVIDALQKLVIPRLDEHDRRFDEHDRQFALIHADLRSLDGRVEALENDVKELYFMKA